MGFHLVFTEPHLFQQLLFAAKAPGPPRPVEGTAAAHRPCAAAEELALREVARQAGDFGHEESGEGSHLSPDDGFFRVVLQWYHFRIHGFSQFNRTLGVESWVGNGLT